MEYSFENVDWLHTLAKLGVGYIAILIYALFKFSERAEAFTFRALINENKPFWNWAGLLLLLVVILTTISPALNEAVKTVVGLDVGDSLGSFLILGWSLSSRANKIYEKKKKLINEQKK